MKKIVIIFVLFISIANKIYAAIPANDVVLYNQNILDTILVEQERAINRFNETEKRLRGDFANFLDDLHLERERARNESEVVITNAKKALADIKSLVGESRRELARNSHLQNRNVLIASIFLWISITIFIIMNLVFANNLKKELYFLRNGLLRSEMKDNMIALSEQLNSLNEKLDKKNKFEEI